MVTTPINKDTLQTGQELKLNAALTGVQALPAQGPPLVFQGSLTTPQQLVQAITAMAAPFQEIRALRMALAQAIAARRQNAPKVAAFLADLQASITATHGAGSTAFTQCGFKTRKKAVLTSATLLVRAQKAKATRLARNTLGPKQRPKVTGQLTSPLEVDPRTKSVTTAASPQASPATADATTAPALAASSFSPAASPPTPAAGAPAPTITVVPNAALSNTPSPSAPAPSTPQASAPFPSSPSDEPAASPAIPASTGAISAPTTPPPNGAPATSALPDLPPTPAQPGGGGIAVPGASPPLPEAGSTHP